MNTTLHNKKNKKHKGSALSWVAFVLTFTVGILSAVLVLLNSGLKQATAQENNTRAFYLAQAGSEIGIKAVTKPIGVSPSGGDETLLTLYKKDPTKPALTDTIAVGDGTVKITVSYFKALDGRVWVQINSVATITDRGTQYQEEDTVYVSVDNSFLVQRST